jgi:hypothetical protein
MVAACHTRAERGVGVAERISAPPPYPRQAAPPSQVWRLRRVLVRHQGAVYIFRGSNERK